MLRRLLTHQSALNRQQAKESASYEYLTIDGRICYLLFDPSPTGLSPGHTPATMVSELTRMLTRSS
jgi:hypothetical protein